MSSARTASSAARLLAVRRAGVSTLTSNASKRALSTAAVRPQQAATTTSTTSHALSLRSSLAQAPLSLRLRSISRSAVARGQGETDGELSSSLAEEIKYEREEAAAALSSSSSDSNASPSSNGGSEAEPEFLTQFKAEGIWKIEEKNGGDEVALVREFGNEHIRVLFSIGDLDSSAALSAAEQEEGAEGEEAAENEEAEDDAGFPVRVAITITKPNQGALNIDAQAQDGDFILDAISFYTDAKLASELTVEADWARRGLYVGPQFETLDEKVQSNFYAYLEERGISTNLALFIPELAEWKEQREYCKWLESVKAFVDA